MILTELDISASDHSQTATHSSRSRFDTGVVTDSESAPPKSLEPDPNDTRADALYKALKTLFWEYQSVVSTNTQAKFKIIQAFEQFLQYRGTDRVTGWRWLEPKECPPLLDLPGCAITPLPTEYQPPAHRTERTFASIPHLPPTEFWQKPYPYRWTPVTALDAEVLALVERVSVPLWINSGPGPRSSNSNKSEIAQCLAAWTQATKLDMAAFIRAGRGTINAIVLNQGFIDGKARNGEHTLYIPDVFDLRANLMKVKSELGQWLNQPDQSQYLTEDESKNQLRDSPFSTFLTRNLMDVINICRWRLDHDADLPELTDVMMEAYGLLTQIIQLDTLDESIEILHDDAAILLTGGRPRESKTANANSETKFNLDYLDLFFMLSHLFNKQEWLAVATEKNVLTHPLFDCGPSPATVPRQLLANMLVAYLRLDISQRKIYAPLLKITLNKAQKYFEQTEYLSEADLGITNSLLPPDSRALEFNDLDPNDPASLHRAAVRYQSNYLDLHLNLPIYEWLVRKTTTKFEAPIRPNGGQTLKDMKICGANTAHLVLVPEVEFDSKYAGMTEAEGIGMYGFIWSAQEAGREPKPPAALQTSEQEKSIKLVQAVESQKGLLPSKRLGPEFANLVERMLDRRPEAGSFANVAEIFSALQELLEAPLNAESLDFANLILGLGSKMNALYQNQNNETTLADLLTDAHLQENSSHETNPTIKLILYLAAAGAIPRELWIELALGAYDTVEKCMAISAIELLDTAEAKRLESFGFDIAANQVKLASYRTQIQALVADIRRTQGNEANPSLDPRFQTLVQEMLQLAAPLLARNTTYCYEMRSGLLSVIGKNKTRSWEVRCSASGELLLAIARYLSTDAQPYAASYYGDESSLKITEWFKYLVTAIGSGEHSHQFVQIDLPATHPNTTKSSERSAPDFLIADGLAGVVDRFDGQDRTWLPEREKLLTPAAHVSHSAMLTDIGWRRVTFGTGIGYGRSPVIASIAQELGQKDYAVEADPDDFLILFNAIVTSTTFTLKERVDFLEKIVSIEPKALAMCGKSQYESGSTASHLISIIELAINNYRWSIGLFATNILRHAAYLSDHHDQANLLYQKIITSLATLSPTEYDQAVQTHPELLTPADLRALEAAKTAVRPNLTAHKTAINQSLKELKNIAIEIALQQFIAKKEQPESLGDVITAQVSKIIKKVRTAARKLTSGTEVRAINSVHFEAIPTQTRVNVLQALLVKAETLPEKEAVLTEILRTCAVTAVEMAITDVTKRDSAQPTGENRADQLIRLSNKILTLANRQLEQFRSDLQAAAHQLNLPMPDVDLPQLLTTALASPTAFYPQIDAPISQETHIP